MVTVAHAISYRDTTTLRGANVSSRTYHRNFASVIIASLLLLGFQFILTSPAAAAQAFANSKIADAGLAEVGSRRDTGDNQPGECVKSVQRWVAAAGGSFGGGLVISSYVNSGATEVQLSQVAKGDVLQYTPPQDSYWPSGVHTVVVVANLGNGHFSIVQSNAPGFVNGVWRNDSTGLVTTNPDWIPAPPAGWTTRAWRFGQAYVGHIVQWNGDTKAQKTAWLVGPDSTRTWIPNIDVFNCLRASGTPGPVVLTASTLDSLPDRTGVRAVCTGPPFGNFDAAPPTQNGIMVTGWAIDPDTNGTIDVHVYVNGAFAAAGPANQNRPDVDAAFHRGSNHGFNLFVPTGGGTVCVYGINQANGYNREIGCRHVPTTAASFGSFDSTSAAHNGIYVWGWTIDPDTNGPIDVHVYLNGVFVAAASANQHRPDVDAVFHRGSSHGFSVFVPHGGGTVCVYGLNFGGGHNTQIGCRNVPSTAAPFGAFDSWWMTQSGVYVSGWVIDPDTNGPIGVHVYVNGAFAAAATANQYRPDVDAVFHRGANHGYRFFVPTGGGNLCLYAINFGGGLNTQIGCRNVFPL
jgi:hypothetical protein